MSAKRIRTAATGLLATVGLTLTAFVGLSGPAQAAMDNPPSGLVTGCPSGAVCVYPDTDWNGGNPSYVFWSYGAHQIYNEYDWGRVYNNQWGYIATAYICDDSYGEDCDYRVPAGHYMDVNLSPINSIDLTEPVN